MLSEIDMLASTYLCYAAVGCLVFVESDVFLRNGSGRRRQDRTECCWSARRNQDHRDATTYSAGFAKEASALTRSCTRFVRAGFGLASVLA